MTTKAQRIERLSNGLCSKCGLRPLVKDKTLCQKCLDYKREETRRIRESKFEKGICKYCKEPALEDNRLCLSCRDASREYKKNYRKQKKELGLCLDCNRPSKDGNFYCEHHLELKKFLRKLNKENLNDN